MRRPKPPLNAATASCSVSACLAFRQRRRRRKSECSAIKESRRRPTPWRPPTAAPAPTAPCGGVMASHPIAARRNPSASGGAESPAHACGGSGPLLATDRRCHSPPVGFAALWRLLLREVSGAAAATPPRRPAPWRRLRWGPRVRRGCSAKAPAAAGRWRFCGVFGKSLTHPPYRAERTRKTKEAPLRRRSRSDSLLYCDCGRKAEHGHSARAQEWRTLRSCQGRSRRAARTSKCGTIGGKIAATAPILSLTPLRLHYM